MDLVYRITVIIVLALLAGPLYALTINILIMGGAIDGSVISYNLGEDLSSKAALVWMGSLPFGVISLFVKNKWGKLLSAFPLIAPSIFSILYALNL
jgi:hypothetical protein